MDVSQPRSWYIRLLILTLCAALYASMWGSYVYYNCEVVHNGEKIKLRDAVGNFMKSQAVQVNDLYEENLKYNLKYFRNFGRIFSSCTLTCSTMGSGPPGLS